VMEIVAGMLSGGAAQIVMGNHEFNALGFHTLDGNGGICVLKQKSSYERTGRRSRRSGKDQSLPLNLPYGRRYCGILRCGQSRWRTRFVEHRVETRRRRSYRRSTPSLLRRCVIFPNGCAVI
jgi:hypothetical protein